MMRRDAAAIEDIGNLANTHDLSSAFGYQIKDGG
jgi:hypothetical protein